MRLDRRLIGRQRRRRRILRGEHGRKWEEGGEARAGQQGKGFHVRPAPNTTPPARKVSMEPPGAPAISLS